LPRTEERVPIDSIGTRPSARGKCGTFTPQQWSDA